MTVCREMVQREEKSGPEVNCRVKQTGLFQNFPEKPVEHSAVIIIIKICDVLASN